MLTRNVPTLTHTVAGAPRYQKDAGRNWDLFYKRNTTNFYKNRHWLVREFPELVPEGADPADAGPDTGAASDPAVDPTDAKPKTMLEVGCGVGNAIFPLLEAYPTLCVPPGGRF